MKQRIQQRVWIAGTALLATSAAFAASPPTGQEIVQQARTALESMVDVRKTMSREEQEWELGRQLLEERVGLVQRQIDGLREEVRAAEAGAATFAAQRAELEARNQALKDSAGDVAELVSQLEARLKALLPRLPAPIRERVRPLSQRLPEDGAATTLSLSERAMAVVGILNQVNKFHREVTLASEVLALDDGTSAEVAVLYFGVSQGWYATANGAHAGIGGATAEGWTWQGADAHAPAIRQAIAIQKSEAVASFVQLPVSLD